MKRPFLFIVIFFSAGIAASRFLSLPISYPILLGGVFSVTGLLIIKKRHISHAALYTAVFFLGMAAYCNSALNASQPRDNICRIVSEDPKRIFLKGRITDDPIISDTLRDKEKTSFLLNVDSYKYGAGWETSRGNVLVNVFSKGRYKLRFGDRVTLEGSLSRPDSLKNPGIFNYSDYLAIKDIYAVLKVKDGDRVEIAAAYPGGGIIKRSAYSLRQKIREFFDGYLDQPYRGFLKALIIGDRGTLKKELTDDFVKTGTVHILAISGLNISLIAAMVICLFGMLRLPKRMNLLLALICLAFYSILAGSNPPVLRATIIFAVFAAGALIRRDADILNSLAFAAFVMLLWNPKELFDPSFQLSFVSVASIMIFTPRLEHLCGIDDMKTDSTSDRVIVYILKGISVSVAAWLGTWPFIAAYFNIISPVAVIANLVVIPVLFVLTVTSFLFCLAASISGLLASIMAWILAFESDALFRINSFFAQLPLAYINIASPGPGGSILYYALLSLAILPKTAYVGRIRIDRKHIALLVLLMLNLSVWAMCADFTKDGLKITFLDVGQGDCAFLELPKGGNMLIDAGSGGEDAPDAGKRIVAPYLRNKNIGTIDTIVITHFHADHLGGVIYLLKNFKIGCVIDNGGATSVKEAGSRDGRIYDEYARTIKLKNIRHIIVGEGDVVEPSGGVKLFVLNPQNGRRSQASDENEDSVVLKLVYKNFSALFCGDIKTRTITRLMEYDRFLKSDVIKVPHHGSNVADERIMEDFFKAVCPQISIINAGRNNRYRAPSEKVVDMIKALNSKVYITMDSGAVTILTGPKGADIKTRAVKKI